jgi:hypothetical protein
VKFRSAEASRSGEPRAPASLALAWTISNKWSARLSPSASNRIIRRMRNLCWLLIGLAALAFAVGTTIAFAHTVFLLEPVGYWRGAVGFLLFAIAIRLMSHVPN